MSKATKQQISIQQRDPNFINSFNKAMRKISERLMHLTTRIQTQVNASTMRKCGTKSNWKHGKNPKSISKM